MSFITNITSLCISVITEIPDHHALCITSDRIIDTVQTKILFSVIGNPYFGPFGKPNPRTGLLHEINFDSMNIGNFT